MRQEFVAGRSAFIPRQRSLRAVKSIPGRNYGPEPLTISRLLSSAGEKFGKMGGGRVGSGSARIVIGDSGPFYS